MSAAQTNRELCSDNCRHVTSVSENPYTEEPTAWLHNLLRNMQYNLVRSYRIELWTASEQTSNIVIAYR